MRVLIAVTAIVTLTTGCASPGRTAAGGQADQPRRYVCRQALGPIQIDGRINDQAWAAAPWTALFVDIEGSAKPPPRYATRVKMLWDDECFYIAALLEEPHVWGHLTQHDQIVFNDNDFEIFIDPDGDTREYYEIEVNALNTIFDLFLVRTYIDGGPALHAWDCKGMRSAVFVDGTLNNPADRDRGWSIEFAIPWKTLAEAAHRSSPPEDGDIWRVNFSRVEWRCAIAGGRYAKVPNMPEDNWVWSPQGKVNMHLPEHWGYVRFAARPD